MFLTHKTLNVSHACSRDEKSDQTVPCDVLKPCAHLYMLCEWVFCSHCREVHLPATENGPKLREKFTNFQTVKNAKDSNFSSSNCYGPNLMTRTKATGLPVTVNCGTASQFEDRLDSHTRRSLRMLVLFVVLLVDHNELVYILVESFSHVRRAFFCILVLLEQKSVVRGFRPS